MTILQLTRRSLKQLLAQKSITEIEHPPHCPDLDPDDFWLFPKIKSALKERRFQDIEDTQKNESYSTKGVPKIFPPVSTSLG
jgi:hypothetical protein